VLDKQLIEAAESGNWSQIDLSNITKEMISETDDHGRNIFHIATVNWQLDTVPKDLWDNDLLIKTDNSESSVIHLAAKRCQLRLIPEELFTKENLLKPDIYGWTALAHISSHYPLTILPKELLTRENLKKTSCLTITARNLCVSKDETFKEILHKNIKIILSKLNKADLQEGIKNYHDADVKPTIVEYINKELNKKRIIERLKKDNLNQAII
jgi:hypothetical protein